MHVKRLIKVLVHGSFVAGEVGISQTYRNYRSASGKYAEDICACFFERHNRKTEMQDSSLCFAFEVRKNP